MMLRLCLILILLTPFGALAQETPAPAAEATAEAPVESAADTSAVTMEEAPEGFYDIALLQGLNKVTARISKLEAPVGTSLRFGNLEVIVKRCWKSAPNERPENAALMEIIDRKPDEAPVVAFDGWMFSSSPSLAGLEHPVYDIIVLDCERRKLGAED